ncbi:MAG: 6-phospho-beta-glucosidase [Vicinamibacteria bacterium]
MNGFSITLIGGAGVRTPLLVRGLVRSGLPISEIRVFDVDRERVNLISPLVERVAGVTVKVFETVAECVKDARFVIASIRPGGIERRAQYEQIALEHGVIGQETVGVGGWAMALATIPAMVGYAKDVAAHAPDAWMISFTNPVGMVTEGVLKATQVPMLGICDTPTELFEEIAHAIGVSSSECHFDYFGLNHLGWVSEVWLRGEPQMARILASDDILSRIYHRPLFDHARLRELRALPTEYVYFYERPERALANTLKGKTSRGAAIAAMNAGLFESLRSRSDDPVRVYEAYLAERNGTYFSLEGGGDATTRQAPTDAALLSGYDKIAVSVIQSIHANTGKIIPLSVSNHGNIEGLRSDDVVEVPCLVNGNGAHPLHVGAPTEMVRGLLDRVKAYERATVAAALSGSRDEAIEALAMNPLVGDKALARRLADALL